MAGNEDLAQAVEQVHAATDAFIMGNPEPFKALWSHQDDVTILGGWGAYEQGWRMVNARLDWAAARFAGGKQRYETLAMGRSGDLAYTVHLEQGDVRIAGRADLSPMTLRVTHILRREGDGWRLVHRHADPITQKSDAEAVLQR